MLQKPHFLLPLPCLIGERPIYVNSKQFHRILKMRAKRAHKAYINSLQGAKEKYKYETRHIHAQARQRNEKGRFLSKNERFSAEKENFEHEDNLKGWKVRKKSEETCMYNFEYERSTDKNLYSSLNDSIFLNQQDNFLQIDTDGLLNYFEGQQNNLNDYDSVLRIMEL